MPKRYARPLVYSLLGLILLASLPALAAPPSNDSSSSALALNLPAFGSIVDIEEATLQAGEQPASCAVGGNDNHSVWFRVTAPTGTLRFETTTNNAGFDTVIAIYPTPDFLSFPNLVELACAVNPGGVATLELVITGGSFLIRVARGRYGVDRRADAELRCPVHAAKPSADSGERRRIDAARGGVQQVVAGGELGIRDG
ncbi:MAG: hypothetical protein IPK52_20725 [Chloroflexi bacterium]|nr:hypothetical protein [Chloroflexota bacterium]